MKKQNRSGFNLNLNEKTHEIDFFDQNDFASVNKIVALLSTH